MRRSTRELRSTRIRTRVLRLVLGAFVCRALIPVGFMPASLDAGGPVIVCHGSAVGLFLEALVGPHRAAGGAGAMHADAHAAHAGNADHAGAAHAGDNDAGADHAGWEHCPVGAAYTAVPLAHEFPLSLLSLEHVYVAAEPTAAPAFDLVSPYRARGPPRFALSGQLS